MRGDKKSICFISPFMGPLLESNAKQGTGGAERQFYLTGMAFASYGWRVVFVADCPNPNKSIHKNVEVYHVPFRHLGGKKTIMPIEMIKLFNVLKDVRTYYYSLSVSPHLALVIFAVTKLFASEMVYWGQTSTSFDRIVATEPRIVRWIRWLGIIKAKYLIAQTLEQMEAADFHFGRKSLCVPNITMIPDKVLGADKEYVFWCGNVTENKRAEVFIELAKMMPKEKFIMAMNGDEQSDRYKMLSHLAHAIPNIRFLGSVPHSEIDQWFAGAKVYVHTAIREGFPNTYIQSWQQGCPVVSVNIDPNHNLMKEGLGLCLYTDSSHVEESFEGIATKIRDVLSFIINDKERLVQYDKICRAYVAKVHSEQVVICRLIEILTL